jgi:hypothetical protein
VNAKELTIHTDREMLTQTLLETARILQSSGPMTYKRSSYRALGRVLFLLRHLCRDHLSTSQLSQISEVSRELGLLLRGQDDNQLRPLDYAQLPRL